MREDNKSQAIVSTAPTGLTSADPEGVFDRFAVDQVDRDDFPGVDALELGTSGSACVCKDVFDRLGESFGYAFRLVGDAARYDSALDVGRDGSVYLTVINADDPRYWRRLRGRLLKRTENGSRVWITRVEEPERVRLTDSMRDAPLGIHNGTCEVEEGFLSMLMGMEGDRMRGVGELVPVVLSGKYPRMFGRGEIEIELKSQNEARTVILRVEVKNVAPGGAGTVLIKEIREAGDTSEGEKA
jgi:hypothetical protein